MHGLWRGNGATLLRVVPYSAITYTTFSRYEGFLTERVLQREADPLSRFVAGALAGCTAVTCTYPLDLLRARMAAHWSLQPRYASYRSALQEIAAKEGPLTLFDGLKPTLLGVVPYAGLSFAGFETLKAYVRSVRADSDVPTPIRLACGGLSGLGAMVATYPLHVVRRRMQVAGMRANHDNPLSSRAATTATSSSVAGGTGNFLAVLRALWKVEGWRGCFKGMSLNIIKGASASQRHQTWRRVASATVTLLHAAASREQALPL